MSKKQTHNQISGWFLSHLRAIRLALGELIRAPISNFLTILVIGIAISLPLGFIIVLENLQYVDKTWETSAPTISLYLQTTTTPSEVDALIKSLRANSDIKKVTYISPEEGLTEFEKNTPFGSIVKLFQHNPIPGVIRVLPIKENRSPESVRTLYLSLKQLSFVDVAQLDMNWITRLYDVILIGKKVAKAISILFAFSVVLIIAHTLRGSLAHHLREIQILRLIGASNAFIRRPLLYRGVLYGLLGGAIAWLGINLFLTQLQPPITQLAETYHTTFQLHIISLPQGLILLGISALLGLLSAWLILSQFLNQAEQEV